MTETSPPFTVKCPNCKRDVQWTTENLFRPFCCERCKLIDLGEWAMEEKVIPGDPLPTESDGGDEFFFQ
ncbi:MAG: DNA gyrase inhibitor YacG [Methyloglobulus sp.]|nr:DNA gyrase inhibitor YacG [Methyloglobulus sp.]